jgi:Na+-driven multidrug efflux pump
MSTVLNLTDKAKIATKIHFVSVIINLILDYILIFGIGYFEGYGVGGAAIATIIAMIVGITIQIIVLRKSDIFIFSLKFKYLLVIGKKILNFVLPNMIQGLSVPIGLIFINSLVTKYSIEEVAAFTVIFRFELLYLSLAIGVYVAMGILISRSMGQKKYKKIQYIYNYSNRMVLVWAIFIFIFSIIFGKYIGGLFLNTEKSIEYFVISWPLFNLTSLFWWFIMSSNTLFMNLGKPIISTKINLSRIGLGLILGPLIGSYLFGFYGLILGVSVGTLISSIYVYYLWKKNNIQEKVSIKRIF